MALPLPLGAAMSQVADSLGTLAQVLRKADSLTGSGNLDQAEGLYREALKHEKRLVQAWRGLGRIEAQRHHWGGAADWFSKVQDLFPNDPEAHYYLGVQDREAGKFKGPLLRQLDFRASEKHFRKVIAADSLFSDVWYQWALLERYREHYLKAIDLTRHQIRLRPDLVEPKVGLYRLYGLFIEHSDSALVFSTLDEKHGSFGEFFCAEKLRRLAHLDAARVGFDRLLRNPGGVSETAIYLHLARVAFEQGERDIGRQNYWRSIRSIRNDADAELAFNDVKLILSDEEYAHYLRLHQLSEKRNFFNQVWQRRNPFPAAEDNPRLVEHYRRLLFAERWYRQDEPHRPVHALDLQWGQAPKALDLNEEFNQKGLVYIRWGEPDAKSVYTRPGEPTYESWLYKRTTTQPQVIVHFANPEDSSPSDWRISLLPPPSTVQEMNMEAWDVRYHRYATARSLLEQSALAGELELKLREDRHRLLKEERMVFPDTVRVLPVSLYWATLKQGQDSVRLNFYYALAFREAFEKNEPEGLRRDFESGLAVFDTLWAPKGQSLRRFFLRRPAALGQGVVADAQVLDLPPGVYHLTFYLRDRSQKRIGSWHFVDTLRVFPSDRLSISDLTVAHRIDATLPLMPGRFQRNGVVVLPNPMRAFSFKQPVYVYYEIYGLAKDESGAARCRVTYTLEPVKKKRGGFLGLWGSKARAVAVTNDFSPPPGDFPVYTALDVRRFPPGEVRLRVEVTDLIRGDTVEKGIPILLVKE